MINSEVTTFPPHPAFSGCWSSLAITEPNAGIVAIYWLKEYGLIAKDATGSLEDFGFRLEESYRVLEVGPEQYYTDLIKRQQELNESFENGEEITIDMIEEYDSNSKALEELFLAMSKVKNSE